MRLLLLPLGAALLLTGCIDKIAESRVKSALLDAGLSERNSACMAERMVDRLSISQLRKLENLAPREGEPKKPTSLSGYVERVRRVGDVEVLTVTSSSAALCAAGFG
ncbi:hypothetical protein [Erythrobacter sp. HKB08]|uniref:hypothetical protein n=1 Tax=Erythrobacter sp. HKB08 TaxID=2502843 RepID=UPI00100919BF|nr:hypothetical protein [Erythrobacter sp. HKB08]